MGRYSMATFSNAALFLLALFNQTTSKQYPNSCCVGTCKETIPCMSFSNSRQLRAEERFHSVSAKKTSLPKDLVPHIATDSASHRFYSSICPRFNSEYFEAIVLSMLSDLQSNEPTIPCLNKKYIAGSNNNISSAPTEFFRKILVWVQPRFHQTTLDNGGFSQPR